MKRLLPTIGAMALFAAAPAQAQFALTDLSNVPDADFGGKAFTVGSSARSLVSRFGDTANVLDYGADPTGAADSCAAFTAALATGRSVVVPFGSYTVSCALTVLGDGQNIVGSGRFKPTITFTNSGGPSITFGGSSAVVQGVGLRHLNISTPTGVYMFQTRWARGVRFLDLQAHVDGFGILGDDTLSISQYTYVFEMYDGVEVGQQTSPTLDFLVFKNFAGQYVANDAFLQANCTPQPCSVAVNGIVTTPNIQPRIDDFQVIGGYTGHWLNNYYFHNSRVVNAKFVGHHSELAGDHAFDFDIDNTATVGGFDSVSIVGTECDSVNECVYVNNNSSFASDMEKLNISGLILIGSRGVKSGIFLGEGSTGSYIAEVNIDGVTGLLTPTNGSQDVVTMGAGASVGQLKDISVRGVNARAIGTAFRAGVYLDPAFAGAQNINLSDISAGNATVQYSATAGAATTGTANAGNIQFGALPPARLPTAAITGGSIDATTLGAATPAVGNVSTLRVVPSGATPASRTDMFGVTPAQQQQGTSANSETAGMFGYSTSNVAPVLGFNYSRSATLGGQTIVQVGDDLGRIDFGGSDGTQFIQAAEIRGISDQTPGTNDMPGALDFRVTPDNTAAMKSAMRLVDTGHLVFMTVTAPTVGSGAASCGTSATIAGNDSVGRVTVGSGANGGVCTVTFGGKWNVIPVCAVVNETSANPVRPTTVSSTAFGISGVLTAGDKLGFHCLGYQ